MKADWLRALEEAANKFWKEEYPKKSFEEKVEYWKKTMEKGMLEQSNLGLPQFSIFNKDWYESVKEQENEIEMIVDYIFKTYWISLNFREFQQAILSKQPVDEDEL